MAYLGNRSKVDIERIILDIRQLKAQSSTDNQIMEVLNIPLRTYRRYLARIYKDDKKIWSTVVSTQLQAELLRLKEAFEEDYKFCKEKLKDPELEDYQKIEWLQEKTNARMNIVKLLTDSPELIDKVSDLDNTTKEKRKKKNRRIGEVQEESIQS
jgi:hypothetical protein